MASSMTPIEDAIRQKITAAFQPTILEIKNDSHLHAHHEAMKGNTNKETHFRLVVASDEFAGVPLLARHRKVYSTLDEELKGGLHALNITAKTPEEYEKSRKKDKEATNIPG